MSGEVSETPRVDRMSTWQLDSVLFRPEAPGTLISPKTFPRVKLPKAHCVLRAPLKRQIRQTNGCLSHTMCDNAAWWRHTKLYITLLGVSRCGSMWNVSENTGISVQSVILITYSVCLESTASWAGAQISPPNLATDRGQGNPQLPGCCGVRVFRGGSFSASEQMSVMAPRYRNKHKGHYKKCPVWAVIKQRHKQANYASSL